MSRFPRTLTCMAIAFALWSSVTLLQQEAPALEVPRVNLSHYPGGNTQPAEPAGGAGLFPLYA
jgi:hypothetical protein